MGATTFFGRWGLLFLPSSIKTYSKSRGKKAEHKIHKAKIVQAGEGTEGAGWLDTGETH